MHVRNPFTSVHNLTFQRNCRQLPQRPPAKSLSAHRSYFPNDRAYHEYPGSYFRDSYLADCELRNQRARIESKVMGIEALKYQPEPWVAGRRESPVALADYYNLDTFHQQKGREQDRTAENRLPNSINYARPSHRRKTAEENNNERQYRTVQEEYQTGRDYHNGREYRNSREYRTSERRNEEELSTPLKNSTRDMFGSDYFGTRYHTQEEEPRDNKLDSYQLLVCKKSSNSQKGSRFKRESETCKEESDEESHNNHPDHSQEDADSLAFQERMKKSGEWSPGVQEEEPKEEPLTLFLKSRGKLYFLQEQQES